MKRLFDWLDRKPDYDEAMQRRIYRDEQLRSARLYLTITLGREPTSTEIWNEAPPA